MGDIRQRDGILEHQTADKGAPEVWVRIAYTDTGAPLTLAQGGDCTVTLDAESGFLIFNLGGEVFTTPPDVAAKVNDALAVHVPAGKGKQVGAQVAQIQAQIDDKRAELADVTNQAEAGKAARGARPDAPVVP